MPHRQNTVVRHATGCSRRPGRCAWSCGPRSTSAATTRRSRSPLAGPYAVHARRRRGSRSSRRRAAAAAAADLDGRGDPTFTVERRAVPEVALPRSRSAAATTRGRAVQPGLLPRRPGARRAPATLVASTEPWETVTRLAADRGARAPSASAAQRLLARADAGRPRRASAPSWCWPPTSSSSRPAGRAEDAARARAAGDEARTVIAGYHWFTDWGRDTMISLEGLTLATGRARRGAATILRTFAHHVRDGLIPNLFPEGETRGPLPHRRRDAVVLPRPRPLPRRHRRPRDAARCCCRCCADIVEHHLRGTRFGIGVDPADGLLRQGAPGYQLTWMDAKVGDWVVTPRRGKAVEINALWYNALRLLDGWLATERGRRRRRPPADADACAERARDVVQRAASGTRRPATCSTSSTARQGDDPALPARTRCFAISLPHPVLDRERWAAGAGRVSSERLLTPVGLRSLAPGAPRLQAALLRRPARARRRVPPGDGLGLADRPVRRCLAAGRTRTTAPGARRLARRPAADLGEACIGSVSEVFDAEAPYTPRGCIAQAWSVAEVLRASGRRGRAGFVGIETSGPRTGGGGKRGSPSPITRKVRYAVVGLG